MTHEQPITHVSVPLSDREAKLLQAALEGINDYRLNVQIDALTLPQYIAQAACAWAANTRLVRDSMLAGIFPQPR